MWENAVALAIGLLGMSASAPLDRPGYALVGALLSAVAARIAIAVWERSGLPPFRKARQSKTEPRQGTAIIGRLWQRRSS
jgi:hypothetical protein